ncbi:MAG: N-acetyltransferase [Candidatus Accumulibacter sp.]|nr:N-acetyltransferase [Accumulibacter sp.]
MARSNPSAEDNRSMKLSAWQRLRATYRQLGFIRTSTYVTDRLLRALNPTFCLYQYQLVAQPLSEQPRLPANRGKAFSFRVLDAPDPLLDSLPRPTAVIAQRFAQGAQCLAAVKDERLAGCIWFARGSYMEDEVRVDYCLPTGRSCVWDFDVFVAESERLGFLFAKLWDIFDAHLKTEGVAWTLSRINSLNQYSLASHLRLGAAACGWAMILRLSAFELLVSNLAPYLSAGTRKRQALRLPLPLRAPR